MQKIKLGIIGAGRMGITHYSIINSHPDVQVESVADPSALILTMMNKYLSVKTYKDYNDLIEESKVDAILVCTPPNLHFPIIKKAAEKGIHVFVEKPFTTKYDEASELARLYSGTKLVNQVGYVNRFNDVFTKVKELLDASLIGNIVRFKSEMFSCTITNNDEGSGWRATRESGGGAVFEMASHAIDLVNFLIGKPDKIIGSSLNQIYSKNVEDIASTTLIYKNGISGTLYVNWSDTSYRKPTNKMEIFGLGGRILADQHSLKIYLNQPNEKFNMRQGWNTLYITDIFKPVPFYVRGNEFTRQLYHFVDCIQGKSVRNLCTFADGVSTLEVIENLFNDYEENAKF
ncbi:MAG: Gfo/Idh/MocA family oxidoreductase [Paludibacter sp.]|nr:Gfo/Idh/MocA family oxidoreductase [Paludibacter sp.]